MGTVDPPPHQSRLPQVERQHARVSTRLQKFLAVLGPERPRSKTSKYQRRQLKELKLEVVRQARDVKLARKEDHVFDQLVAVEKPNVKLLPARKTPDVTTAPTPASSVIDKQRKDRKERVEGKKKRKGKAGKKSAGGGKQAVVAQGQGEGSVVVPAAGKQRNARKRKVAKGEKGGRANGEGPEGLKG